MTQANNTFPVQSGGFGGSGPEALASGLKLTWKMTPSWLKLANVHVIRNQKDITTGTGTTNSPLLPGHVFNPVSQMGQDSYRYGITLTGDAANIDYRVD